MTYRAPVFGYVEMLEDWGASSLDYDQPLSLDLSMLRRVAISIYAGFAIDNKIEQYLPFHCFDILRERRDDLLPKLILALNAELHLRHLRTKLTNTKRYRVRRRARLKHSLDAAAQERDKAWRDYEIYRRFIDYDNHSIMVAKA